GAVEPHHSPNVPPSTSVRSTAAGPRVRAPTAILVDLKTGRVLFAKQPDQRRPIASLAKIMTAMVVLERSKLSDVVEVSRRAANAPPTLSGRGEDRIHASREELRRGCSYPRGPVPGRGGA